MKKTFKFESSHEARERLRNDINEKIYFHKIKRDAFSVLCITETRNSTIHPVNVFLFTIEKSQMQKIRFFEGMHFNMTREFLNNEINLANNKNELIMVCSPKREKSFIEKIKDFFIKK